MLVVIVGTDGAGKTSLSKALDRALIDHGITSCRLDRFGILNRMEAPAAGFVHADVDSLRQYALDMSAPARLLFYLWSMALTVTSTMARPDVPQVIIYDSYWIKHVAVEIAYGEDEHRAVAAGRLLPAPDLTIYLKASPAALYERKIGDLVAYECGMNPACERESFISHQTKLKERLDHWSEAQGWHMFDALRPTDELAGEVAALVMSRLPKRQPEAAE
jgi:thymidylate kinase